MEKAAGVALPVGAFSVAVFGTKMKITAASSKPEHTVRGSIVIMNEPREKPSWENRNRFWGFPMGVNILPVFAAMVWSTITKTRYSCFSFLNSVIANGTKVNKATSFVISMAVKKHRNTRTTARVLSVFTDLHTRAPRQVKIPQEEKPATTVISEKSMNKVSKLIFETYAVEGGTNHRERTVRQKMTVKIISFLAHAAAFFK